MAIKHLGKNLNRIQQKNQKFDLVIYSHTILLGMEFGTRQSWWTNITCGASQQNCVQIGLPFDEIFHR